MNICTNNVPRELACFHDIPVKDREWFDYLAEYVQTIAPDIDDAAALDILTEYSERFSEYPWLEDETLVMDKGIDEFILGKLKEGEKAIKENCELITYRGSECA